MRCPLCSSTEMHLIAVRENVPVLQNVICKTDAKAKAFPVGKIQLFQCASCKFVTNAVFDQVAYGEDYENYQGCSRSFSEYMDTRAKRIADCADTLSGSTLIVEIGCGQGTFLQRILHYMKKECDGLGFDPAYRGTATDRRVRYISEYFVGGGNKVLYQSSLSTYSACFTSYHRTYTRSAYARAGVRCCRCRGRPIVFGDTKCPLDS